MPQTKDVVDNSANDAAIVVAVADLPVHCPTEAMGLWNSHPRVFIPLHETDEASCPYCGTRFVLEGKTGSATD